MRYESGCAPSDAQAAWACEMSETWRWCSRYNPQKEETGNDKISLW